MGAVSSTWTGAMIIPAPAPLCVEGRAFCPIHGFWQSEYRCCGACTARISADKEYYADRGELHDAETYQSHTPSDTEPGTPTDNTVTGLVTQPASPRERTVYRPMLPLCILIIAGMVLTSCIVRLVTS